MRVCVCVRVCAKKECIFYLMNMFYRYIFLYNMLPVSTKAYTYIKQTYIYTTHHLHKIEHGKQHLQLHRSSTNVQHMIQQYFFWNGLTALGIVRIFMPVSTKENVSIKFTDLSKINIIVRVFVCMHGYMLYSGRRMAPQNI